MRALAAFVIAGLAMGAARAQQLEATSVACRPSMVFTSWPAKREVAFALEGTLYTARVVLREREALTPLQPRP